MIVRLFAAWAVLAATISLTLIALADPSATLTVHIGAAGVPAPAARAGFTTQALNADFTATSGTYSTLAGFVDTCGASTTPRWYLAYPALNATTQLPCSDLSFVNDTANGGASKVLLVTFPTAAWSSAGTPNTEDAATISLEWPAYSPYSGSNPCSITGWAAGCLPNEMYAEWRFRIDHAGWDQNFTAGLGTHVATWAMGRGRTQPTGGGFDPTYWTEIDYMEMVGNSGTTNSPQCTVAPCVDGGMIAQGTGLGGPQTWETLDISQWHTFGVLVTSDESTAIWKCTYIDGVLNVPCTALTTASGQLPSSHQYTQHDNVLSLAYLGTGAGAPPFYNIRPVNPIRGWYQYAQIWTCANYQTTGCPGTMITGP